MSPYTGDVRIGTYIYKKRISHQQYPLLCYVIRMGLEPMTPTLKVLCSTS